MAKIENVYPYTDLLWFAESEEICSWNEAIGLLEKDGYLPFYEARSKEIWRSEEDPEDGLSSENETLRRIIDGFCDKNKVSFITIIDS